MARFLVLLILGSLCAHAEEIANPGFEQDLTDWTARGDRNMSATTEEAARSGKIGLRVIDEDTGAGSNLTSLPFGVTPGTKYELSCWARGVSGTGRVGVYFRFLNEKGKPVKKEKVVALPSEVKEWKQYTVVDTAPETAVQAQIWVHSFAKDTPVVDIDDFELKELPAGQP
jgi:hypothetical protein